jgi:glycerol-3-phosphate dehydrogenase (NAD(P)+)
MKHPRFSKDNIRTMSEVIREETSVIRIGALSGPNLYREILDGQPAATVLLRLMKKSLKYARRYWMDQNLLYLDLRNCLGQSWRVH